MTSPITIPQIQFSQSYEPEKARRLADDLRRVGGSINSLIGEVTALQAAASVATIADHVLATTVSLGEDHTTSGLEIGMVLRAFQSDDARFEKLQFRDLFGVDQNTFDTVESGDILQYLDGFYSMVPLASIVGATSLAGYVLATAEASLPNSRVLMSTDTVNVDLSVMGEARFNVEPQGIDENDIAPGYSRHFLFMGA